MTPEMLSALVGEIETRRRDAGQVNIASPSGTVHAGYLAPHSLDGEYDDHAYPACGPERDGDGWRWTPDPVTCRRCRRMRERAERAREEGT